MLILKISFSTNNKDFSFPIFLGSFSVTELALKLKLRECCSSRCHSPSVTSSASLNNPAVTSRKNLDTIVEAIRHLEGDHMFNERRPNENCRANSSLSDSGFSRSETVIVRSSIVTTPSSKATQPTAAAADRR